MIEYRKKKNGKEKFCHFFIIPALIILFSYSLLGLYVKSNEKNKNGKNVINSLGISCVLINNICSTEINKYQPQFNEIEEKENKSINRSPENNQMSNSINLDACVRCQSEIMSF